MIKKYLKTVFEITLIGLLSVALNVTGNELTNENAFADLEGQKIDITREVFRNHLNKNRPGTILGTASATYQLVK